MDTKTETKTEETKRKRGVKFLGKKDKDKNQIESINKYWK